MTNHPQFHHMGGVVVETLQDWWFIIGFTTLKPIIQRFQSFLLILIFPIYKWALDFTVFGRTAWGFVMFCLQLEGWVPSMDESSYK